MFNQNFRRPFIFINNTIFTMYQTPLPVADDEQILYINKKAKFSLVLGNGAPAYTARYNSYIGTIYITNYRVIYRPKKVTEYFSSFFITLSNITCFELDSYFEIIVTDEFVARVYVTFEDSVSEVFYNTLESAMIRNGLKETVVEEEDEEDLPLYYEAINK